MLLDTHILIWLLESPEKLPADLLTQLEDVQLPVYVSIVSLFEIAIKQRIGKLRHSLHQVRDQLRVHDMTVVPLRDRHLDSYTELRHIQHGDPFDVALVAVARAERMTLLTADTKLLDLGLDYIVGVNTYGA